MKSPSVLSLRHLKRRHTAPIAKTHNSLKGYLLGSGGAKSVWVFSVMLWVEGACLDPRYRLLHAKWGKDISIQSINQLIIKTRATDIVPLLNATLRNICKRFWAEDLQVIESFDIKYAEDRSGQTESYLRFWLEGRAVKRDIFCCQD